MARTRGPRQSLQKELNRSDALSVGASSAAVGATYDPDQEVQVKRVVASAQSRSSSNLEWSLVIHRGDPVVAGDRDDKDKMVKTGYFGVAENSIYLDFVTTIRMRKGDQMALVFEELGGTAETVDNALVVLFREM